MVKFPKSHWPPPSPEFVPDGWLTTFEAFDLVSRDRFPNEWMDGKELAAPSDEEIAANREASAKREAQAAGSRFQELSAVEKRREQEQARIPVTYKRAMDLLQQGKMLEAEAEFESVLELDSDNAQTRSMLAKIAFSKGDVGGARRWIAEAIEKDASVGEYHYLSALLDVRVGNSGDAEAAVRRSLELTPGFPDAWVLLGTILADTDRTAEAVDCYLKAAALEPSNPTIQLNLASAYAALGRSREENRAMELYRKLSKER